MDSVRVRIRGMAIVKVRFTIIFRVRVGLALELGF
jgi:hypothetical protein